MSSAAASLEVHPFTARAPWWGGDLQTIINGAPLVGARAVPHFEKRLCFPLADGTGDILLAMLDCPDRPASGLAGNRPLVILIHGLAGSEDSGYVRNTARLFLERGYRVLRLNLRGAGASRATCADEYYAGRSEDFRALLKLLPPRLTRDGLVAVGYSLGGAMLLKHLGEEGARSPLLAAATISAPLDLAAVGRNLLRPRNMPYHLFVLHRMKRHVQGEGSALAPDHRAALLGSRTVWEYDDNYVAPRHGFADAEDYYERCSPRRFMGDIRVPTPARGGARRSLGACGGLPGL